jgi:hypothetical protein
MLEVVALVLMKPVFAPIPLDAARPKIPDTRANPVRRTAVLLTTDEWRVLLGPLRPDGQNRNSLCQSSGPIR